MKMKHYTGPNHLFVCRRVLQAMHHAKVEEAVAQAKNLKKAMMTGAMAEMVRNLLNGYLNTG